MPFFAQIQFNLLNINTLNRNCPEGKAPDEIVMICQSPTEMIPQLADGYSIWQLMK